MERYSGIALDKVAPQVWPKKTGLTEDESSKSIRKLLEEPDHFEVYRPWLGQKPGATFKIVDTTQISPDTSYMEAPITIEWSDGRQEQIQAVYLVEMFKFQYIGDVSSKASEIGNDKAKYNYLQRLYALWKQTSPRMH